MNEIRNIGSPHVKVARVGRREQVSERASDASVPTSQREESIAERRRNPDRRRRRGAKPRVERRTGGDRRRPRISIDV